MAPPADYDDESLQAEDYSGQHNIDIHISICNS